MVSKKKIEKLNEAFESSRRNALPGLFTEGSQKHRIVKRILGCGSVNTIDFSGMNIPCHTCRLTEIRQALKPVGFDLIATPVINSTTSDYIIKRRIAK